MAISNSLVILVLVMMALLLLALRLSAYMMKRAVCTVISIFRDSFAIQPQNAMTLEELGLSPGPLFRLRLLRDYKPYALKMLVQTSIIRNTPDGRFYLIEENPELAYRLQCPIDGSGGRSLPFLNRSLFPRNKGTGYPDRRK